MGSSVEMWGKFPHFEATLSSPHVKIIVNFAAWQEALSSISGLWRW